MVSYVHINDIDLHMCDIFVNELIISISCIINFLLSTEIVFTS